MPLTDNEPEVGCCKSAITRSIVVLPQPDGPMKETNSPLAICKLTFDSASTLPSAVSNVSETLLTSTARRCGIDFDSALASVGLFMLDGSIGATNACRPSRQRVAPGSTRFNDFGICNVMGKY